MAEVAEANFCLSCNRQCGRAKRKKDKRKKKKKTLTNMRNYSKNTRQR